MPFDEGSGLRRSGHERATCRKDTQEAVVSFRQLFARLGEGYFIEFGKYFSNFCVLVSELSLDEHNRRDQTNMNIRAIVIAGLVLAGSFLIGNGQASAQTYTIARSVIAAGATPMSNGTYRVDGTIGQAVVGITSSGVYTDKQGFWYTFQPPNGVKITSDPNAEGFALDQNYPNPFNPSTTIKFSVPERTKVTIRVMNLLGEEVHAPLVDDTKEPGTYSIDFSDADNLPSGTYIYRMDAGSFTASKRMVLLK